MNCPVCRNLMPALRVKRHRITCFAACGNKRRRDALSRFMGRKPNRPERPAQ